MLTSRCRSQSISPPPLKRRRRSTTPTTTTETPSLSISAPDNNSVRILSWNINGIDTFLPIRSRNQKAITTFFSPQKEAEKNNISDGRQRKSKDRKHSLRSCIRRWGYPYIICLQEVKIARSDEKTQDAVRRAVNPSVSNSQDSDEESDEQQDTLASQTSREGRKYNVHFSLPRDNHNARGVHGNGKVYGVCTLVRKDILLVIPIQSRALQQQKETYLREPRQSMTTTKPDWDLEGRVLVTLLPHLPRSPDASTSKTGLAVFNVYAVNGTTNPHRDSSTGAIIGDRHAHKRRFHTLLASAVKTYEEQGYQVVVTGDLNISRTPLDSYPSLRLGAEHVKNRADFEKKFMKEGLGMVDTFRYVHGQEQKYTYRPPGKPWGAGMDRVDLILFSRNVAKEGDVDESGGWNLVDADILDSVEERGPSDHVPLFVDIAHQD